MNRLISVLIQAVIWSFAGALYGGLFIALLGYALQIAHQPPFLAYGLSFILSSTVIAAFFGSMLVALGGTLSGILVSIGYQLLTEPPHILNHLLVVSFLFGLLAGVFFTPREFKIAQPLAQASAGLLAGLLAAPLVYYARHINPGFDHPIGISTLAVIVAGLFYVILVGHMPESLKKGWALRSGGILVSALIAATIAGLFWLIGTSAMQLRDNPYQAVLELIPYGLSGGAAGGALGGALLELLGLPIEEHIY